MHGSQLIFITPIFDLHFTYACTLSCSFSVTFIDFQFVGLMQCDIYLFISD